MNRSRRDCRDGSATKGPCDSGSRQVEGFVLGQALSTAGVTAFPRRKWTSRSTRRVFIARRVHIWGILDDLSAAQGTLALLLIAAVLLQYGIHIVSDPGHNPGQPGRVMSYLERLETPYQSVQALSTRGALLSAPCSHRYNSWTRADLFIADILLSAISRGRTCKAVHSSIPLT
jgi:hypothetical protein